MSNSVDAQGASGPTPEAAGHESTPEAGPGVDRAAALARGAPGIPANFVLWVLGAVLVLSVAGLLGEHLFSSGGLNPTPATTTTTAPTPAPSAASDTPNPDRSVSAPLAALMGLATPRPTPAPAFTLTDQSGHPTTVPAAPPRVVVLTFFNAPCNDICPVLASELEQADADLGARASAVELVTVNTDPAALAASAEQPVLTDTHLGTLPNWHMLTGPLATLDTVWKAYGVSISVATATGLEAHNDVMVFIDAHGDVRYRATPFADESPSGSFTSPAGTVARWGEGIATYAKTLLGP